ncbi:hypothetical protein [Epilithonimonas caeni]|uniref:hypothetical protein n=1 Tax=Epilithonimonas caeni TaxID=365343 RepID=UPI000422468B|nr:hypothetical protein [Epilithonimonas caeni]
MIDNIILKYKEYYAFLERHPKQVFIYAMLILSVSFIGMIVQGVFFPAKKEDSFKLPVLYSKSDEKKKERDEKEKEMGKIMQQLEKYKLKRDNGSLTKEDSLRINYLFNQYQTLKNGH